MRIDAYSFGSVTIDGQRYTSDVLVFRDRVDAGWWRKAGHRLCPDDLKAVVAAKPEALVVGTGAYGVMAVPAETAKWLAAQGIELITEKTDAACQEFNRLSHQRRVVAALHLTC
jgi:hypothetical protein